MFKERRRMNQSGGSLERRRLGSPCRTAGLRKVSYDLLLEIHLSEVEGFLNPRELLFSSFLKQRTPPKSSIRDHLVPSIARLWAIGPPARPLIHEKLHYQASPNIHPIKLYFYFIVYSFTPVRLVAVLFPNVGSSISKREKAQSIASHLTHQNGFVLL